MKPLVELAQVIRTKNAGPYELTLDIIFKSRRIYEQVKRENSLNAPLIARIYGVPEPDILKAIYFDPACAFKATMKRPLPCGDPGERDIYGAQQHAPLLDLLLPWEDEHESDS
ncbi:MAG: DUF4387 domain-containing protein [Thermacetogeniaceae bacterium]